MAAPVLPNFLIVGAAKAGTSSIWDFLSRHPDVYMPQNKEPAYFCRGTGLEDWDEYVALFDRGRGRRRIGEASASYLAAPESPEWIREKLGSIAIIIILRNPVQRAHSLYSWMVMEGYEPIAEFEQALAAEDARASDRDFQERCPQYYPDYLYFQTGLYSSQVKRYVDTFGQANVRVCLFDDLVKDPAKFYGDLCAFLGLKAVAELQPEAKNPSVFPRSVPLQARLRGAQRAVETRLGLAGRPAGYFCELLMKANVSLGAKRSLQSATKKLLTERYRDDVNRLAALIDRDLSTWLT